MTQTKWLGVALLMVGAAACNQGGDSTATAQSLGEKCAKDSDCKTGESCLAQICVPQLPTDLGVPLCKVTSDCSASEICAHGVCLPQQLGGAGGVTLCDKDADCAAGDQCLAQVCVPKLPSGVGLPFDLGPFTGIGQTCSQKSDCSGTLDCAFGFCLPLSTCKVDADCAAGKHCATQAGLCI